MCEIISTGKNTTAFICRGDHDSDHECNEKAGVFLLSNGDRVPDTEENKRKHWDEITGGSVCCSVCGRAAIDNAMWL